MDCSQTPEQVIARCLQIGINCIAITDHGEVAGALEAQNLAPFPVIVGEEVLTPHGEVMGLFLQEKIPSPIPVEEAIAQIKAQGGLVCIPHPFDPLRLSRLRNKARQMILRQVDMVEVYNARSLLPIDTIRAQRLVRTNGLLASAGSDAHTRREIGNAYIEMPEFDDKDSFLRSLAQGKIHGRRTNPLVHFASTWTNLKKRF